MLVDGIRLLVEGGTTAGFPREKTLTQPGTLVVTTGKARWVIKDGITLKRINASVGTAPDGAQVTFLVKKNGTVIATGNISAGNFTATEIELSVACVAGDYITVDVTNIGTTAAGSDLVVVLTHYVDDFAI